MITDIQSAMAREPKRALREMAELSAKQAAYLRGIDPRAGADGPEKRLAEYFEADRDLSLFIMREGDQELPPLRPQLASEIEADSLCMQAMAPWLRQSAEEKERLLREAVRICDWSAYAHRTLAGYLRVVGKTDEALTHYRRAFALNPENDKGREALVLVLLGQGSHQEVVGLTGVHRSSATLRSLRAHALVEEGRTKEAGATARAVLDEHPKHTLALRALARCMHAEGDTRKARELERQADFYERGVGPPGG